MRYFKRVLIIVVLALAGLTPSAWASPPANDDFANADVVSSLPFVDGGDLTGMTFESGEPSPLCIPPGAETAWYVFTPSTSQHVTVDLSGSAPEVMAAVWSSSGGGFAGLSSLGCTGGYGSTPLLVAVTAGSTYYVQVGHFWGEFRHMQLAIDPVLPPSNDNFANAAPLTLPARATVDLLAATVEAGEPAPTEITASAWYTFTAPATSTYLMGVTYDESNVAAVYTGTSLADLAQVAAKTDPMARLTFSGEAGVTYHVQVAKDSSPAFFSVVEMELVQAPAPIADFWANPLDPSVFDTVHFVDNSFDPAYLGPISTHWDFGDGSTATECCPSHRYAADGDYEVSLTVTTIDGRTATLTRTIAVGTHDVSIERVQAPNSARVGQTKNISVNLRGGAYPETVWVELWRSVAGGSELFVGAQTVAVPVGHGGPMAAADFTYTFTSEDALAGKVTFRAVAFIQGFRDALPADNQSIVAPTNVKR